MTRQRRQNVEMQNTDAVGFATRTDIKYRPFNNRLITTMLSVNNYIHNKQFVRNNSA